MAAIGCLYENKTKWAADLLRDADKFERLARSARGTL
jgi:hypothetical protein